MMILEDFDMKLELKSIKHAQWKSEETHCYNANLYVDGKPFAIVGNHGQGGADSEDQDPRFKGNWSEKLKEVEQYCREAYKFKGYKDVWINGSMEHACHVLMEDHLERKHYRPFLKQICGITDGKMWSYGKSDTVKPTKENMDRIRENGEVFLNELPEDEAIAKIKATAYVQKGGVK
tara:strand:- start:42 stop:572 length:531 start_codon:yes stop_codon:yes gene_type:complete